MTITAKPEHTIAFDQVRQLIETQRDKHGLTDLETLAVTANLIGKMLSTIQNRVLMDQALQVIRLNTKLGFSQGDAGK